MPVFKYEAMDSKGKKVSGKLEFETRPELTNYLKEQGLFATSIEVVPFEIVAEKAAPKKNKSSWLTTIFVLVAVAIPALCILGSFVLSALAGFVSESEPANPPRAVKDNRVAPIDSASVSLEPGRVPWKKPEPLAKEFHFSHKARDISFAGCVRKDIKVFCSHDLVGPDIENFCKVFIEQNFVAKGVWLNAVSFNLNTQAKKIAMVEWAPYGDWSRAADVPTGDYLEHKFKVMEQGRR